MAAFLLGSEANEATLPLCEINYCFTTFPSIEVI